ncbi:unnamed protein product [Polarella glacialis]|uniref:Uncharacterized protein n=1 Tax=Polarella glacialis TaxID=89957 RepID=A0A813HWP1_POLGL|nr:unnamed protein product [Polarella glacialis]
MRVAAHTASVCFGNLSRGAVPGMDLSRNIPQVLGLSGAMDMYLTDGTLSAYAALRAGLIHGMQVSNQGTKQLALSSARRLAESPESVGIAGLKPPLDLDRYATEAWAIDLSAKSGGLFRSVAESVATTEVLQEKMEPKQVSAEVVVKSEDLQEWKPRQSLPKQRPKRRVRLQGSCRIVHDQR